MAYTFDDYYPPFDGELDTRRLALFADNRGLRWACRVDVHGEVRRATVTVDDIDYLAEGRDDQAALEKAIDVAISAIGNVQSLPL